MVSDIVLKLRDNDSVVMIWNLANDVIMSLRERESSSEGKNE